MLISVLCLRYAQLDCQRTENNYSTLSKIPTSPGSQLSEVFVTKFSWDQEKGPNQLISQLPDPKLTRVYTVIHSYLFTPDELLLFSLVHFFFVFDSAIVTIYN